MTFRTFIKELPDIHRTFRTFNLEPNNTIDYDRTLTRHLRDIHRTFRTFNLEPNNASR